MTPHEQQRRFESLVEEHRRILFKVCHAYAIGREDREDLAQEILAQLWRSFQRFDGRSQFSTWMYRVALNTALSFARREVKRKRTILSDESLLLASPAAEPDSDELRLLHQLIGSLDPLNKALILLYLDGNNSQEISQVLGISPTNAATKLNRLKAALKTQAAVQDHHEKENTR